LGELDALGRGRHPSGPLPVAVTVVLAALDRSLADGAADGTVVPRLQARGRSGRRLTLHAALTQGSEFRPSERIVVIAPAVPERPWWREASPYGLTDRETEVVDLVVRGRSTREIADELFIAEHTVQRHLSNIFEKVGVRGRRALVKRLFVEHVVPGFHPD
jgi:DNA-binding CsgD family transcriptional regulator